MIDGEPDPLGPDLRMTMDAVALHFGDERLNDLVQESDSRLSADESAAWHAWRQDWELRVLHRVQVTAGVGAGVLAIAAALSALSGDPDVSETATGPAWSAAVVLCGAALFVELSMSTGHPRFLTFPTRVRLASRIRTRVNLQSLRDSAIEELIGGRRAEAARLVIVARSCASSITGSAFWCTDGLDALRVRCDVELVLTRIARGAADHERQRVAGGCGPAGTDEWESLVDRLGWLQRYELQLRMLTAVADGGSVPADRRPSALADRIVSELRFSVLMLTWTD